MTTAEILDLLESIFKLGVPMAALSWFIFARLYSAGDMDRSADRKAIKQQMKSLASSLKTAKKAKTRRSSNPVFDKWMWFGGGFYGLAALWTFVVVEANEIFNFLFHNPGREVLFRDGLVGLFVDLVLNQIQNIVTAFVWFNFWETDSIVLLVLVAYAGYWTGVEIARREFEVPVSGAIDMARNTLGKLRKPRQ